MERNAIPDALATLGHPDRLAVFRLLMRFAPQGVRPTEIALALNLKANTLSHHLSDLDAAGLITANRQGRNLFYHVRLDQLSDLITYFVTDLGRNRPDLSPAPSQGIAMPNHPSLAQPKPDRPWNVLFLCSGNSARSIFAEAILRDAGKGRFNAYSAGTKPGTSLNPHAVDVLIRAGLDVTVLRSKHLSEFQADNAPRMDFVFTVCDTAALEDCAPWPGQPMTAHWGIPDPVKAVGTEGEKALAFATAFANLRRRIIAFAALPFAELEKVALQGSLDQIGKP
jgi:protein-tyrosine-phosphatase/DNA-binding transcriptional ArsR family regulator